MGWEYFAARNGGVTVEEYAQAQLDALGESYVTERQQCIRTGLQLLVELMLQLPEEERLALEKQVTAQAAAHGLIPL